MNMLRGLIRSFIRDTSPDGDPDGIVILADAPDEMTAQIWRDQLRDNQIEAQIVGVGPVVYSAGLQNSRRLLVLQRNVERAREVLELDVLEGEFEERPERTLLG